MSMRRIVLALVTIIAFAVSGKAQSNSDRLSLGIGCLYQNGLDLTLSYERIGASAGSDTHRFLGGIHFGYEHNYVLCGGWQLFCQVKTDLMIKGEDLFRTGIVLGIKLPLN